MLVMEFFSFFSNKKKVGLYEPFGRYCSNRCNFSYFMILESMYFVKSFQGKIGVMCIRV